MWVIGRCGKEDERILAGIDAQRFSKPKANNCEAFSGFSVGPIAQTVSVGSTGRRVHPKTETVKRTESTEMRASLLSLGLAVINCSLPSVKHGSRSAWRSGVYSRRRDDGPVVNVPRIADIKSRVSAPAARISQLPGFLRVKPPRHVSRDSEIGPQIAVRGERCRLWITYLVV